VFKTSLSSRENTWRLSKIRRKEKQLTGTEDFLRNTWVLCFLHNWHGGRRESIHGTLKLWILFSENRIILYFHRTLAGRKIDLLKKNPDVTFSSAKETQYARFAAIILKGIKRGSLPASPTSTLITC
jgi:hypothetical protein